MELAEVKRVDLFVIYLTFPPVDAARRIYWRATLASQAGSSGTLNTNDSREGSRPLLRECDE